MNLTELVQSSGWKSFMAKLYGFGASIVIVGALFKIQHWPAAGTLLTLGLLTEATIFFFSAFEPLHEEVDWTLVYPELAGITDEEAHQVSSHKKHDGSSALERFDALLEKAEITPDLFRKLGQGISNLNDSTQKLTNVTDASLASNEFAKNLKGASDTVTRLSKTYSDSADKLTDSVGALTDSYKNTATIIANSGNKYEGLTSSVASISEGSKVYSDHLESLNKNLAALNAVYELQLQGSNEHMKSTQSIYKGLDKLMEDLKASADDTKKYRVEVARLSENLSALNTIYGNMLAAMNVRTNQ